MRMLTRLFLSAAAVALIGGAPLSAQTKATAENVPTIPHTSVPNFFKLPADLYFGEGIGIATNSKGHVFVYHRSGDTRLFEFDPNGTFVKEWGVGLYGIEFAHQVRVDSQDNVWVVDEGTNMVIKFNPAGRVVMVLGRRPEPVAGATQTSNAQNPFVLDRKYGFGRPTDVTWDPQGNIFVSDGYVNSRVVKFDKNGRFVGQFAGGERGDRQNQLNTPHSISADAQGNIYVGDRGNRRIVVLEQRPDAQDDVHERGQPVGGLRIARPASVSVRIELESRLEPRRVVGHHRRDLQDGARRQDHRQVRQGGQRARRVQHGPRNRLPQSGSAVRVRDLRMARAEDHPESIQDAAGDVVCSGEIGGDMKRALIFSIAAALAISGGILSGQTVPTIQFESNPTPLTMPDNIHLGEVAGVATNSRGDIYVYTRTGNPTITIGTARAVSHGGGRLFQFDRTGKYVREIGQGIYGFLQPQQVRVDPQDNVWVVDQMSSQVIKFDSNGRVQMVLSRKPEAMTVPAARMTPLPTNIPTIQPEPPAGGGWRWPGRRRARRAGPIARCRRRRRELPAADGRRVGCAGQHLRGGRLRQRARVAKYDRNGKWMKNWGSRGTGQGQFNIVHGIAIDAQGNVYVGDEGNKRVQVFDTEGTFKTQFTNVGAPTALCLTRGAQPVLYVAHTGDPDGMDDAAIYKIDLKGNVIGRFGSAGKLPKEFSLVNSIDCRNENELLVGELANWRVQKITLRAAK